MLLLFFVINIEIFVNFFIKYIVTKIYYDIEKY